MCTVLRKWRNLIVQLYKAWITRTAADVQRRSETLTLIWCSRLHPKYKPSPNQGWKPVLVQGRTLVQSWVLGGKRGLYRLELKHTPPAHAHAPDFYPSYIAMHLDHINLQKQLCSFSCYRFWTQTKGVEVEESLQTQIYSDFFPTQESLRLHLVLCETVLQLCF